MAKAARKLTTALAVSAALLTARAATAADASERATIVLHVDDFANLLPCDLAAAETMASRIFRAAGIRTVWLHGREKSPGIDGALHLKVLVLSRGMAQDYAWCVAENEPTWVDVKPLSCTVVRTPSVVAFRPSICVLVKLVSCTVVNATNCVARK